MRNHVRMFLALLSIVITVSCKSQTPSKVKRNAPLDQTCPPLSESGLSLPTLGLSEVNPPKIKVSDLQAPQNARFDSSSMGGYLEVPYLTFSRDIRSESIAYQIQPEGSGNQSASYPKNKNSYLLSRVNVIDLSCVGDLRGKLVNIKLFPCITKANAFKYSPADPNIFEFDEFVCHKSASLNAIHQIPNFDSAVTGKTKKEIEELMCARDRLEEAGNRGIARNLKTISQKAQKILNSKSIKLTEDASTSQVNKVIYDTVNVLGSVNGLSRIQAFLETDALSSLSYYQGQGYLDNPPRDVTASLALSTQASGEALSLTSNCSPKPVSDPPVSPTPTPVDQEAGSNPYSTNDFGGSNDPGDSPSILTGQNDQIAQESESDEVSDDSDNTDTGQGLDGSGNTENGTIDNLTTDDWADDQELLDSLESEGKGSSKQAFTLSILASVSLGAAAFALGTKDILGWWGPLKKQAVFRDAYGEFEILNSKIADYPDDKAPDKARVDRYNKLLEKRYTLDPDIKNPILRQDFIEKLKISVDDFGLDETGKAKTIAKSKLAEVKNIDAKFRPKGTLPDFDKVKGSKRYTILAVAGMAGAAFLAQSFSLAQNLDPVNQVGLELTKIGLKKLALEKALVQKDEKIRKILNTIGKSED